MSLAYKFVNSLVCLSLLFILGCSSGGTGGTGANNGGSSVVVGTITQINTPSTTTTSQPVAAVTTTTGTTVTINGVQFDVSSSTITLDGLSGTDADLRVGMVATIQGSVDTNGTSGIANSLIVKEAIKGPVSAIDTTNNTLTILDQTVQASTATRWDNFSVADISGVNLNDIVEVSGFVKNNNVITATRIELLSSSDREFKVTGTISNLNTPVPSTFNVGTLVVDYSNADLSSVPNGTLSNGMYVEVKGTLVNNQLSATQIATDELDVSNANNIEIQGFITSTTGTPVPSFSVNHQTVQIDSNTQFSNGTLTDIVPGVLVDVQGPLVNGILIANQVSFEDSVKITAVINNVGMGSFTLSGLGTLSISGDASTEFDGMTMMSDLMKGDTVTIHGNLASPNNVTASQISLESMSASADISLQGPIDTIASDYSSVTLLGLMLDISTIPDSNFVVEGSTTTGRNYFFSVVTTGDVIDLQGTLNGNLITWNAISYEIPSN